jgi:chromosome segregation ATPase
MYSTTDLIVQLSKALFDSVIQCLLQVLNFITRHTLHDVPVFHPSHWAIILSVVMIVWVLYLLHSYQQLLRVKQRRDAEKEAVISTHSRRSVALEERVKVLEEMIESKEMEKGKEMEEKDANVRRMNDEILKSQLDDYRAENDNLRKVNYDLQSELEFSERSLVKVSKEIMSYEHMYEDITRETWAAEAEIEKSSKAMEIIYKNFWDLKTDVDAKLILLNMKSFAPVPRGDDAKAATHSDHDLEDLREALGDKESEIKELKSKLKDQFRLYQRQMAEKVVEVIDLKRDGRAQNMRLTNAQRKVNSSKRRMCREITRRIALTRSINSLQQTKESLEDTSRTSQLECDSFKRKYDDLKDKFESSQSKYNSLKKRFDDLQVQYDSLRSENDSLKSEHGSLQSEHDSIKEEHDNLQLESRELEEAHENSELEHRKREEELENEITEIREALNLSNVRVQDLGSDINDERDKASGLNATLRQQTKQLKKTRVIFKNQNSQISRLKSTLKRNAGAICRLQMVIEEAKIAVHARDQRISDLDAALRKTAEDAREEVDTRDQRISGLEAALRKTAEERGQAQQELDAERNLPSEFEQLSLKGKSAAHKHTSAAISA